MCLWWSGRKNTRRGSGSRAQHPSKMHKGGQVLHVQAPRCPGRFYGRDALIRNAAKEETQKAPDADHCNQHAHTMRRALGGGDWRITKGTRQGDVGCDISLGVYGIPLKKYVICRQPTSEMMSLEEHRIDESLLTFVDDLMDILIESTPGAMNLRDRANDENLTHELGKVRCELESRKEESLIRWMGSNARKHLAKCRSRRLLGPGRFPQTPRHFGCRLETRRGAGTMVRQKIMATRTSFYRYAGLWKSRHVSFQIRRTVFQSVINGAVLSGCDPRFLCSLSPVQLMVTNSARFLVEVPPV